MGESKTITEELKARGIEPKFSIPDEVNMVGVFQEYITMYYVPEVGMEKDEIVDTAKKLNEAYNKEVYDKMKKIHADFCEEYGVKLSTERIVVGVKRIDRLRQEEAMMDLALNLFT